ncbi:hypothetical protein MBLNU459_g7709t1 [Dothideomycetes sp. NU459]
MATPDRSGKTMSSRLLTMKFMQRAAASSPTASSPAPSSHDSPSQPPTKRQRLSTSAGSVTAAAAAAEEEEARAVRDALAAEDHKRAQAIDRAAADAGESKWVLSFHRDQPAAVQTPLRIVSAGYSTIDSAAGTHPTPDHVDEERLRPSLAGRRSFGKFNRAIERQQNPDLSSSSSSSDDADDDSDDDSQDSDRGPDADDDPSGTRSMIHQMRKDAADRIRSERKAARQAGKAELARLAAERRNKEVNLNKLGGISNGGKSSSNNSPMQCYGCGQRGHKRQDCPSSAPRSKR